ncbi:unnamed protein product [Tuber aestivum]|uniref:Phosphatidate phosphatase APP1 catalytic domain-containing protein n=1 Tax=Tuber aestivum TaxID=59557 RepID=A0A292PQE1_9PEZI|nr:unnamed protein product [Tuber aestivum]
MAPLLLFFGLALLTLASPPPENSNGLQPRAVSETLADILDNLRDGVNVDDIKQSVLPDFWSIPGTDEITKELGLNETGIRALPLEFLNIPGYANYTSQGWNVRFHGMAYKQPLSGPGVVSNHTLDEAANKFLPDFDISELQPHEQDNSRNLTSAILSLPQEGERLLFALNASGGRGFQGGWTGVVEWAKTTDSRGEISGFVQLPTNSENGLPDGNATNAMVVELDVHTNRTDTGNATAYLVPRDGITILSDIDDILRVTKIYVPKEGLLNSFARDFVPWMNMPEIFTGWFRQHPDSPYHFHYLTTTPEQATRVYMDFIYKTYPLGSFDTRPLNFTTVDQTFSVRRTLLNEIFQTFPNRKFILIGDTTNSDVMSNYPELVSAFPGQVQCILLRNTSATDPDNGFPYNTKGFETLKQEQYMFFTTPDDLRGLDFANGDCRNASARMGTVDFSWQGLPFEKSAARGRARGDMWAAVVVTVAFAVLL